jgi:hypothetical protein
MFSDMNSPNYASNSQGLDMNSPSYASSFGMNSPSYARSYGDEFTELWHRFPCFCDVNLSIRFFTAFGHEITELCIRFPWFWDINFHQIHVILRHKLCELCTRITRFWGHEFTCILCIRFSMLLARQFTLNYASNSPWFGHQQWISLSHASDSHVVKTWNSCTFCRV